MNIYKDKVAMITGGGSGIGKALGEKLAKLGAHVVLSDINNVSLEEVINKIKVFDGQVEGETLDVTDYEAFKKHMQDTVSTKGRVDYLFNNAGIAISAEFRDMELEHWQKVLNVNLNGVFHGSLLAYKQMVKQGFGHIVNISSVEGLSPFPMNGSYVATKYAVLGLSQTMWLEGQSLGVKVSAVCPGVIKTPLLNNLQVINIDREKIMAQYSNMLKLGITPEKCACVILKGVAKDKPIIIVTGLTHVIWILTRLFPVGLMKLMRNNFDKWRDIVRLDAKY